MSTKKTFSELCRDRIFQRYCGEFGTKRSQQAARDRIHWLGANTHGHTVLDIGCSEDILCILLGREHISALGVDINMDAIEHAQALLTTEPEEVRGRVSFLCAEIMALSLNTLYDTVILGNVLEHITNPKRFVDKAISLCNEGGVVLVTASQGVTGVAGQKVVLTLSSFLDLFEGNHAITPKVWMWLTALSVYGC